MQDCIPTTAMDDDFNTSVAIAALQGLKSDRQ